MDLMVRETLMGGRLGVRLCSGPLPNVMRWLASVEVLVKGRCRVRGLIGPSGNGWGGTTFSEVAGGGKAKRHRVGESASLA